MWKHKNICPHPDGDTDYFHIIAGVLQEDALVPYLFIICIDYVLRTFVDIMVSSWHRKEAEDTPHKQLWTWTTPLT